MQPTLTAAAQEAPLSPRQKRFADLSQMPSWIVHAITPSECESNHACVAQAHQLLAR
jgi:hypothetical protein